MIPPSDRLDQLRAEIAMLEAERDRRAGPAPRLDMLIAARRLALSKLEQLYADTTNPPAARRRRHRTERTSR